MKLYKTTSCNGCELRNKCTHSIEGRVIYRWKHEELIEEMRERVKTEHEKVKKRREIVEHPFGTIKRAFNQGYMLMKGMDKVGAEIGLTVLVYNLTRVINIVGISKIIDFVRKTTQSIKMGVIDSNYSWFLCLILREIYWIRIKN